MSNRRNKNLKALFALCIAAIVVLYGVFVVNWDLIWKGFQGEKTVRVGVDNTREYEAKLAAKTFEIEILNGQIITLNGQIQNLQSQITTLSETITGRDLTIEEKQAAIISLNKQFADLTQTISKMTSDALVLKSEVDELTSTNINQSIQIEALTALVSGHLLTIEGLENTVTQLQGLIAYLESTIPNITLREEDFIAKFYVGGAIWDIQVVEKDGSPVLPNIPSGNWTFVGWTIDGENIINPTTVQMQQDKVFNAIIDCTVTFIVEGNIHATQTVRQDDFVTEPAEPTIAWKTFVGWSVNGVNEIDVETHKITENTSFVALIVIIPPISLAEDNWVTIGATSKSGFASEFYSIGDRKDVTISAASDGSFVEQTLTFVILGFNHDTRADGGLAGITFGMENLMIGTRRMNASNTNVGGWKATEMRQWIQNIVFPALPAEVQAVIVPVNKTTTAGGGSTATPNLNLVTTSDNLFLFADVEITGIPQNAEAIEGVQYEYWRSVRDGTVEDDRIKYLSNGTGASNMWWFRSPVTITANSFYRINAGMLNNILATAPGGVCFGFAV